MSVTRVVLVRHGESLWNAQRRLQGQGGSGLSPLGHRQAKAAAQYLHKAYPDAAAAVASDLERVTQTARPWVAQGGADPDVEVLWREIDVGTWSGLTWPEVEQQDPERYSAWRSGADVRRGGGETFAEFRVRIAKALHALRGIDGTVIVFTHGGSVRFAVAEVLDLPVQGERALAPVDNCSVTEVVLRPDGGTLTAYNLSDHLVGLGTV